MPVLNNTLKVLTDNVKKKSKNGQIFKYFKFVDKVKSSERLESLAERFVDNKLHIVETVFVESYKIYPMKHTRIVPTAQSEFEKTV